MEEDDHKLRVRLVGRGEKSEDMVACTARIGEVFLDVEDRVLIEQPVEHIGSWSNGQAEGQINRLKTLKRAMYGRAGPELMRARMLPLNHRL